jgi:HK97 family phage major capsid protein
LVLKDFENMIAILPLYADAGAKIFASKLFWSSIMTPLLTAAGGNTISTLQDGTRRREFLGYPVELVNVMPKVTAVNQIPVLFGDISLAAKLGDRMSRTISTSGSYQW